ncbi:hypothetical protein vseg_001149 [Gypsophila vaccaria]
MCTLERRNNLFILTLTGDDDDNDDDQHRLNPSLISSIRTALASIKTLALASPGTSFALITTARGKFFSNGFDLKWAQSGPNFLHRLHEMVDAFKPVVADLISLPMPTVAAVTGHAAAAGFVLAVAHDYAVMRADRGVLYMSEVDIGMTFPEYFNVLFREKVSSSLTRREIMLRGRKFKAAEAVQAGVVDSVGKDSEEVVQKAVALGDELVKRGWHGGVYAEIRKGLYPHLCQELCLERTTLVVPRL